MKLAHIGLTLALLSFAVAASAQEKKGLPAASASPQSPPTVAATIDRQLSTIEKQFIEAAEAMPEDKFNFSPENLSLPGSDFKGVRTFAAQIKHVAATNYFVWAPITGYKLPADFDHAKGPDDIAGKADIIRYLKESFAFGHKAIATLTTTNLLDPVELNNRPATRLFLATLAISHCFDHYGQMAEYLRMNGIVPPASRANN